MFQIVHENLGARIFQPKVQHQAFCKLKLLSGINIPQTDKLTIVFQCP
jgi:hypothetical protein